MTQAATILFWDTLGHWHGLATFQLNQCHTWQRGNQNKVDEFDELMVLIVFDFFSNVQQFRKYLPASEVPKMIQPHRIRSLQLGQQRSHSARLGTAYDASGSVAGLVQAHLKSVVVPIVSWFHGQVLFESGRILKTEISRHSSQTKTSQPVKALAVLLCKHVFHLAILTHTWHRNAVRDQILPASAIYWVICVVFPLPVSPMTIRTSTAAG